MNGGAEALPPGCGTLGLSQPSQSRPTRVEFPNGRAVGRDAAPAGHALAYGLCGGRAVHSRSLLGWGFAACAGPWWEDGVVWEPLRWRFSAGDRELSRLEPPDSRRPVTAQTPVDNSPSFIESSRAGHWVNSRSRRGAAVVIMTPDHRKRLSICEPEAT
jgi:hypothetical protein